MGRRDEGVSESHSAPRCIAAVNCIKLIFVHVNGLQSPSCSGYPTDPVPDSSDGNANNVEHGARSKVRCEREVFALILVQILTGTPFKGHMMPFELVPMF